ncbi:restriction endonuclease subunit S [Enterococcus faecalis]|uniref:restriction endonuclease subunit S n=3 Tax=Enterococcus TaxID=1350 RepID=UPI002892795B|nr:restriction endonuclease subunit S [Enterococcus faecalis]MDT2184471.1 restriction endonuclease subunit S [Enterococcus faecalis]
MFYLIKLYHYMENLFNYNWELCKLSTEFEKVNERNDGSLGKEHWISVAKMYFQNPDKVQSNNIDTRTYVMRTGDIAFEGHPNKEFKFGRFVANDIGTGVVSELFPIYRHKQEYDNYYWKNAIQIERVMGPIFAKSITSSGNSSNKLDPNHFLRQQVFIPKLEEQKKIGLFLKKLDDTITLHQRKLDQLKELKKAYLKAMLISMNTKNNKVPKLRFADFEGEWDQRKFKAFSKKTGKKNSQNLNYPAYSVSNKSGLISQSEQFNGNRLDTLEKHSYKIVEPYEFAYNPARINVGSIAFNTLGKPVIVSSLYVVLQMEDNLNNDFILQFIKSPAFVREVKRNTEGSVREYLFYENFANIKFPYTKNIKEQQKIGAFFKKSDDTIALRQNKLNQLKALKKAYLQNMFI